MGRIILVIIVINCLFFSSGYAAEYEWKLLNSRSDIELYHRSRPLSKYRTYKAISTINIPVESLIEVLLDVNSYPDWMPGCTSATTVSEKFIDSVIKDYTIHILWDAQWPVKNRDFVMETRATVDWNEGLAFVELDSIDNSTVPVPKNKFRLKKYWGKFEAEYISRNVTKVTYYSMINPGGKVGPKLSNAFTKNIPKGIMKGLRRIATKDKYKKKAIKDFY